MKLLPTNYSATLFTHLYMYHKYRPATSRLGDMYNTREAEASARSQKTKHWGGKRLFTNNACPPNALYFPDGSTPLPGGHFHWKLYHIRMKKKKHGKRVHNMSCRGGRETHVTQKWCQNHENFEKGLSIAIRYD